MKSLLLAIVIVSFASFPKTYPPNSPRPSQSSGAKSAQVNKSAQKDKQNSQPSPQSAATESGNQAPSRNHEEGSEYAAQNIEIQRHIFWITAGLASVAFITALVIGWQSWETRRAVTVQIIGTQPWLTVENWSVLFEDSEMHVGAEIFNRGRIPIILSGLSITMHGQTVDVKTSTLLVPDEPYIFWIPISLTVEEVKELETKKGITCFLVVGSLKYADNFLTNRHQDFSGYLSYGRNHPTSFLLFSPFEISKAT
jgi:hypothetical protein